MAKKMLWLIGVVVALGAVSCGQSSIEGSWVEPIPGMERSKQGIMLNKGGKASSINMETLKYEKWSREGDLLILSGESIGNHQTLPFVDTLLIKELTIDRLLLERGELTIEYQRETSGDVE